MQVQGLILSVLLGFLPMFAFAYMVYFTDRYEKEPFHLLAGVFLWGAIFAAGMAFLINTLLGMSVYLFTGSETATEFSTSSTIAPITEEILKGTACLFVFLFFRREFDSVLDGIVYAAITAIGFAATENIYYLYTYGFLENGVRGLLSMFFIRVVLVGWQHPFYTAFFGIGLAVSRLNKRGSIKIMAPLIGLGIGIFAHSFHNTLASIFTGLESMLVGMILDWSGWIAMGIFIIWALFREQKWIKDHLQEEVSHGIITPAQYITACSAWAQTRSRIQSFIARRYRITNRFYLLTAELAYKKQQVFSLDEPEAFQVEVERLRKEIGRLSSQVTS